MPGPASLPTPGRLPALLRANPDFRRLLCASAFSMTGDWFTLVALSGFVYRQTGSAALTAVLFAVNSLPGVVLIPLIGPLTDGFDRRRLRIACDLGAVVPVFGLLVALRLGSVPLALGALAVLSAFAAVSKPVPETVLPNLVAERDLPAAQAALGSVYSGGLLVGAGLGGLVAAVGGASVTLLVDACSFAVSALLVWRIRSPFATAAPHHRMRVRADTAELGRFVRATPAVAAYLWLTAGLRLSYGMVGLLPVYALARFHVGESGVGALYLAQGVGAVLGPFVGRRLAGGSQHRRFYVTSGGLAVFGAGYLALAQADHLVLGMAAAAVGHVGVGACGILSLNGLQVASPDHIRGRIMVLAFGLAMGLQGVSALAIGPLAAAFGMATATRVFGVLAVVWATVWMMRLESSLRSGA
ncbi:MFS transporter [Streptomyces sp. NPDC059411]|uniref:MFS transporter n=1 Tax=Streptomyces sp. NPDC059411 TaxID=3346825 RepID=UPI0036A2A1EA